jgi:hypothetical protein
MSSPLSVTCYNVYSGMTYPKTQLGKIPKKPLPPETEAGARQAASHAANMQKALCAQLRENFHTWSPSSSCEPAAKVQVGSSSVTSIAVALDGSQVIVGCANGELTMLPTSLTGCNLLTLTPQHII